MREPRGHQESAGHVGLSLGMGGRSSVSSIWPRSDGPPSRSVRNARFQPGELHARTQLPPAAELGNLPAAWGCFIGFIDTSDDAPSRRNLTCASASVTTMGR